LIASVCFVVVSFYFQTSGIEKNILELSATKLEISFIFQKEIPKR
jgi:hypothetical protein